LNIGGAARIGRLRTIGTLGRLTAAVIATAPSVVVATRFAGVACHPSRPRLRRRRRTGVVAAIASAASSGLAVLRHAAIAARQIGRNRQPWSTAPCSAVGIAAGRYIRTVSLRAPLAAAARPVRTSIWGIR
jgi:hypothetical protein